MAELLDGAGIRDALLPLAHSLHSTKSSHVLLLGAGVSVPAGVPSAWGVQTELIREIAQQHGEPIPPAGGDDEPGEPEVRWYQGVYGVPPTYQSILARLGNTQTERQRVLRKFFVATGGDLEQGLKIPTAAHRAVAELVQSGHLRIIITLNFDTLVEQAIRDLGIEPTVVSSAADLAGMAPLHTHEALVVHLHGQYLAPATMRNTDDELAAYGDDENDFLRGLLRDYGLIAVGWSATYDPALRDAISRTQCSHFTSYWVEPGQLSSIADQLRRSRTMTLLRADANTALTYLRDAVISLADMTPRHPSSAPVAVTTAKRQLSASGPAIGLHDALNAEFARLRNLPGLAEAAVGQLPDDQYASLLANIEAEAPVSLGLVATTAFWGNEATDEWLVSEIERSVRTVRAGGTTKVLRLPQAPAFLWSTAAVVGAIAAGRWQLARRILLDVPVALLGDQPAPLAAGLTRGALYLDRPPSYPFELLASTFTVQLGLTPAAWVDAWERSELVKVAATFAHRNPEEIENGVLAIDRAALVSPAAAATAQAASVRELADRVRASPIHVRVRDTRFDDLYWPVAGIRLLEELGRTGDAHPLVRSGLFGTGSRRAELVLQAVNLRIAQLGDSVAWQGAIGRFGAIPDYIWLDTGETPERDS